MQPLLSDLCSICHKTVPKYRCPACSTRTCSLECVQRHKSRGCSGKRDPTTYVKKNQLVTPSGVDHDYNFISGIERSRDRAGEHLQGRPIQDADSRPTRLNLPSFRNRLKLAGVKIEYAPLGMSRQKLNKTRLTASKRINWTVEWLHEDGTSCIGSAFDDEEIQKAYLPLFRAMIGVPAKKRKRNDGPAILEHSGDVRDNMSTLVSIDPASTTELSSPSTLKRDHEVIIDKEPSAKSVRDDSLSIATTTLAPPEVAHQEILANDHGSNQEFATVKDERDAGPSETPPNKPDSEQNLYFYLVKPRTTGVEKVLIPLRSTDTLLCCLQHRTILEFPTIQVLSTGPAKLPSGFITEDQYLARDSRQAHEMAQLVKEDGELGSEIDQKANGLVTTRSKALSASDDGAVPNPSVILATLQRDMLPK